jgi:LmbE family N-acetylglucosaminyl deacetylase
MPYPRLRPLAARIRAMQTPMLHNALRRRSSGALLTDEPALVIAPHHDDETLACGGMIAMKRAAGVSVRVVFVTDGSASHVDLKTHPERVTASRREEALRACGILGVGADELEFLDCPDGRLEELSNVERRDLVARLAETIRQSGAREIYVPHHRDRHPDHEATYALTMDALDLAGTAAEVLEYPVWLIWKRMPLDWSLRDLDGAERLDVREVQAIKDRAIGQYASQLPSLPPGFVPQFVQGEEFFWRRALPRAAPGAGPSESDRSDYVGV